MRDNIKLLNSTTIFQNLGDQLVLFIMNLLNSPLFKLWTAQKHKSNKAIPTIELSLTLPQTLASKTKKLSTLTKIDKIFSLFSVILLDIVQETALITQIKFMLSLKINHMNLWEMRLKRIENLSQNQFLYVITSQAIFKSQPLDKRVIKLAYLINYLDSQVIRQLNIL